MKGILLVDKPVGDSTFRLIPRLRRLTGEKKVGHAGTLDPFATGLVVYLIGREYTRLSDRFLGHDKVYSSTFVLGKVTDSYDLTGEVIRESDYRPTLEELETALASFQGEVEQVPPMFSAKKIQGTRLYELARRGEEIERKPCRVKMSIELIRYEYPYVELVIHASKGTYIRSLAYDLGEKLRCGAFVEKLRRLASGCFSIEKAITVDESTSSETIASSLILPPSLEGET